MAVIISPPFGSYVRDRRATRVLGSYTFNKRPGRWWAIAQFIGDNLMYPVPDGWRNRIGLRNPGIFAVGEFRRDVIYSIVGLEDGDWERLFDYLMYARRQRLQLELNLGCQNVHRYGINRKILTAFCREFYVSAKLPAGEEAIDFAEFCLEAGVQTLHVGNTIPSHLGSISGRPLKFINLWATEQIAKQHPGIRIYGGGGIYDFQDVIDYENAGANDISLATIWFHPIRARRILAQYIQREADASPDHAERETGI